MLPSYLRARQSGGNTTTLTYDPANEVKSLTVMNGVTQVSKLTYAYDSDGNRIRSIDQNNSNTTYGYDQANRMVAFNGPSSSSTYTYNGDGLLTQSVSAGAAAQLIWNTEPGLSLLIKTGSASIINGPNGLPEEQITGGGTRYYYHQDQIGSTIALSDSTGTQAQSYAYDPYGNLTASSGAISNPFQFQGQYLDATSGLYYMRARWYDPLPGQFVTRDPALEATNTPYAFTADSPVNRSDVSGLCWGPAWTCSLASAPLALAQSLLYDAESIVSTAAYAPYWLAYEFNAHFNVPVVSPVLSASEHITLPVDEAFDTFQQWTGYPGATAGDEGGPPPNVIPTIFLPTPTCSGGWRQNKIVVGPTGAQILNALGIPSRGSVGPGRHPNGHEDYN